MPFVLLLFTLIAQGPSTQPPEILSMRQRAELKDQFLQTRLNQLIPQLMRREGVDAWILVGREYNEDPVLKTMLPATWLSARRRTILCFFDNGQSVDRLAIARYDVGTAFKKAWDKEQEPDQLKRLVQLIKERNPKKIALNVDDDFALADGLTHSEHRRLMAAFDDDLKKRIVTGRGLAIGWLETRLPDERLAFERAARIAHHIIDEAFATIQPGVTTTDDVVWFMRERIRDRKLTAWFHPTVDLQRATAATLSNNFSSKLPADTIQVGDLLRCDFGITYLGLNTDTQRVAYVLAPGQKDAPEYIKEAFAVGNRLQDILTSQFQTGRSGNQILKAALDQAKAEGIKATIYTHPIGLHGHAAGPTIGLWDSQGGVPIRGDYPLYANTAYAIELNAAVYLPQWKREVRIMREEGAFFDGETVTYMGGRQESLILVYP